MPSIIFQTFFVWALLLIIHTWNSSPLPSNILRLQCTCCTVPITSGRPYGSSLVWACQWPSSQPLSSVVMRQLWRWKRLWRRSLTRSHKRTSMGPSRSCWNNTTSALQPEEITLKGTRVSCVYYQWKCPYKKSLETYRMHLVYKKNALYGMAYLLCTIKGERIF